ncbi:hypothetical protein FFI16_010330 [Pseudomonas sp. KBS0710]|uniref:hypothetical protein n=1 Tax=Pseudomonas sp. KBS0710 TaxID=1179667 RepID=UPI00110F0226|nr:hypothetical protein [Pseudomonas sp. KBS0710]TSD76800.1 hypothetical protein FFI16_010330 [Pseudomonas sp. KBS0710]
MKTFTVALVTALFIPALCASAQASDDLIITPANPAWLLERPDLDSPMLTTARTFGDSAYNDFHTKASLEISCHPRNPTAGLALQIEPQSLGFDIEPFHGPDASTSGPLRIATGTRTAIELAVSGVWAYAGSFQIGTIFAFSTQVPRDELAYWASDASRGQTLKLLLAPAMAGGQPLTATFRLPANNSGLKKVIQPCLGSR